jgi:DHA2 family multidrug resistance protein-like MFS transporter
VAVIGSVFASRYHQVVDATSAALPPGARAAGRDSIGKALEAARHLPDAEAKAILAVARHAYILSMRLAYGIGAGVVLLAAFIAGRYLPARAPAELPADDVDLTEALAIVTEA